jgi:hypothetical protein
MNLINQPYMSMQLQPQGEKFHFIGLTHNFNTSSPPPPPSAKWTPKPSGVASEQAASNEKNCVKRCWSHDEEVRLEKQLHSKP